MIPQVSHLRYKFLKEPDAKRPSTSNAHYLVGSELGISPVTCPPQPPAEVGISVCSAAGDRGSAVSRGLRAGAPWIQPRTRLVSCSPTGPLAAAPRGPSGGFQGRALPTHSCGQLAPEQGPRLVPKLFTSSTQRIQLFFPRKEHRLHHEG